MERFVIVALLLDDFCWEVCYWWL